MGSRKLSIRRAFSLRDNDRAYDAILLLLGVIVAIALLWAAGVIRSRDQGRSEPGKSNVSIAGSERRTLK